MKTLAELFEIIGQAVSENSRDYHTWFINYSGHVNSLSIYFHFTGWCSKNSDTAAKLEVKLDEDGIQAAYWFIKTKLRRG